MSKPLSKALTSYDFLKCYAVILMIADHIGFYFYPDDNWWRVAGRLCVPVWFFLIGYARSRDVGPRLWIAAAVLVAGNIAAGMSVFPLNIMGSMLMVRMAMGPLTRVMMMRRSYFWIIYLALVIFMIPTHMVTEYGTLGIIMALYGYLYRQQQEGADSSLINQYFIVTVPLFAATQCLYFGFNMQQGMVAATGIFIVMAGLFFFRPATFPALTARMPAPAAGLIRLGGRRTLEIYVVHLLLFKVLAVMLAPERFQPFHWTWFPVYEEAQDAPAPQHHEKPFS